MPDDHPHDPVLLDRCVELLKPALTRRDADGAGAVLVDATLGAGGHAERFLTELPGLRLIGLDRDRTALSDRRPERLGALRGTGHLRADPLRRLLGRPRRRERRTGLPSMVSCSTSASRRCNSTVAERGFSYSHDAPLDMRMDQDAPLTAAEILNTYDKRALTRVLQEFGEERFASRIAGEIVRRRDRKPFETTSELVEVLYDVIPAPARRTGGHPAKRTFQALRTAVNAELDSLRAAVPAALDALREGGRIVVMAYQSLEDRIVKGEFASATASRTPAGLPVELPGHEPYFRSLTRGAEKAGDPTRSTPTRVAPRFGYGRSRSRRRTSGPRTSGPRTGLSEGMVRDGQATRSGTRRRGRCKRKPRKPRETAAQRRAVEAPAARPSVHPRAAPATPRGFAAAHQPDAQARRGSVEAEERRPGQGARQGPEGEGSQSRSPASSRAAAGQTGEHRPQPAQVRHQGAVRGAGHRSARPRPRGHPVALDRCRRAVLRTRPHARQVNQALLQQKEGLERDVLEAQAAPALAEAARNLGMIPSSRDTAHLVQDPHG